MIIYEMRMNACETYSVGHEDEQGEWWDADLDGFADKREAEVFRRHCQEEQDKI